MDTQKHPTGAGVTTPVTRIPITSAYALGADVHSWQVQKRRSRKGQDIWEPITWHATIDQAAESLRERLARLSGSQTLDEVLAARKNASLKRTLAISTLLDSIPRTARRKE
jgi:hypothetical protein